MKKPVEAGLVEASESCLLSPRLHPGEVILEIDGVQLGAQPGAQTAQWQAWSQGFGVTWMRKGLKRLEDQGSNISF